jgi:hypothetical protein
VLTLGAVLAVLIGVIFFKQGYRPSGLCLRWASASLYAADQKKAIAAIPWATIL